MTFRSNKSRLVAGMLLSIGALSAVPQSASAADLVESTGSGWCRSDAYCNNQSTTTFANHVARITSTDQIRNWFAFNLPALQVTSATISIWNANESEANDLLATYGLYGASSISYTGLVNGPALGSLLVAPANVYSDDRYITFSLNSDGLAFLNQSAGSSIVLGGALSASTLLGNTGIFGFTDGLPKAYLSLEGTAAVPEPATWAMMLIGFGAVGYSMRSRKVGYKAIQAV